MARIRQAWYSNGRRILESVLRENTADVMLRIQYQRFRRQQTVHTLIHEREAVNSDKHGPKTKRQCRIPEECGGEVRMQGADADDGA